MENLCKQLKFCISDSYYIIIDNELEEICGAIYTDENDLGSKLFAINRISAWRAITSLPHAVEATLSILVVIVHDKQAALSWSPSSLLIRQSYASALLRLVNGLVDHLQVGTYARPITAIAQQLGIPGWLVELRHASTHEDLPSLELLREGARQSMSWLLDNYFLPILNPSAEPEQEQISAPIRPLAPMLKHYKGLMKTLTRDTSLVAQYKPKLVIVLRDLERWIAESRLAANVASGDLTWSTPNRQDSAAETDTKEIWVLEKLSNALAEVGLLVPLAKKKRVISEDSYPSDASVAFWSPLLQHVQALHPDFFPVLIRHLVSGLGSHKDSSYEDYLASWLIWIINNSSMYLDLRKSALTYLMKKLSDNSLIPTGRATILTLFQKLCSGQKGFDLISPLVQHHSKFSQTEWNAESLELMKSRNDILQSYNCSSSPMEFTPATPDKRTPGPTLVSGWSLLSEEEWKPCPMGVYFW